MTMPPARCELVKKNAYTVLQMLKWVDEVKVWTSLATVAANMSAPLRWTPFGAWVWLSKKDTKALLQCADGAHAICLVKQVENTLYITAPTIDEDGTLA